jgi:hypothetical protein
MKLFFVTSELSNISSSNSSVLDAVKHALLSRQDAEEVDTPEKANAIIIQEKNSFKNFNYISELLADSIISRFADKVYTINTDDCATGLLRGLYTSLPKSRFDINLYRAVPYMEYPNDLIFSAKFDNVTPIYLAAWRGNTKSNVLRLKMVKALESKTGFKIEKTNSWLNHNDNEKEEYVNMIRHAEFSLCPAGWAPVSYRIYESMALGKCPVIIADEFVPPSGPNWSEFALFFPERNIKNLTDYLISNRNLASQLGKNALLAWKKHFGPYVIKDYYSNTLFSLISSSPTTSTEAEIKRWKSLPTFWKNKWTLPQRVLNKIRNLPRKS